MGSDMASFLDTYWILDEGDILPNTLSIGGKYGMGSGPDNHGAFEGYASLTHEGTRTSASDNNHSLTIAVTPHDTPK